MHYDNSKLNVHIKTNFNNDKISKNISYELLDINDKNKLDFILKDLKMQVTDIWKEANIVNLLMPLFTPYNMINNIFCSTINSTSSTLFIY